MNEGRNSGFKSLKYSALISAFGLSAGVEADFKELYLHPFSPHHPKNSTYHSSFQYKYSSAISHQGFVALRRSKKLYTGRPLGDIAGR